jgi:hypothetical protein
MRFASHYDDFRQFPNSYDPDHLSNSAAALDSLLIEIADAISRDIEDYFITPTLSRIKKIVSRERGVEYAEVGRTTISGLNGLETKATSTIVTSIDQPTPLRINQLLKDAAESSKDVQSLLPGLSQVPIGSSPGAMSAGSALAIAAALSKEEVRWSALDSGTIIHITPTVFRDRTAAELKINLKVGKPAEENQDKRSANNPTRPYSRISESTLHTKVYVKTMDLFSLSSFNNQTSISGGRAYVPLIGTVWEGAFGDIPVLGGLFSFRRPTQDVQHQSILLTNTLIVPSAMGLASYYTPLSPTRLGPSLPGELHNPALPPWEADPVSDPRGPRSLRVTPGRR